MSDERTKVVGMVIDVLTRYGFMQETPEKTAGAILRPEFFDRAGDGDGDVAKAEVVSIFYDDPDAIKLLNEAGAEALFANPGFRAFLSKLIAPPPAQPAVGAQRFAETAPIIAVGGKAFVAPAEDATMPPPEMCVEGEKPPADLTLARVMAQEEGRGTAPRITVGKEAFTAERPQEGAEVLMPGESYFVTGEAEDQRSFLEPRELELLPQARRNLELALKDMQRGRDGIDDITKQKIRNVFIAITEGRLRPEGDLTLATRVASEMVRLFARHPINALIWAERLLAANIGTGIDLGGERLIVPKAKANWFLYKFYDRLRKPEKFQVPGTAIRTTEFGQFPEAEKALDELTAYLEQYPDVRARLAGEKPELFGAEAIQRLKERLGTIGMIRHASARRERAELLAEAVKDGVLPPVPTYAREESKEESSVRQKLSGRRNYQRNTEVWGPWGEYSFDLDTDEERRTISDNFERLVEQARYDATFQDGESVPDLVERFDRSMRLVDLHSAGLARDISIVTAVFETVGAISEAEGRAAILTKLPSLKKMEHMWRPGQASARTPMAVLERAGIRDDMPTLQEPDRLARKRLRGKFGVVEEFSRLLGATSPPEIDYRAREGIVAMVVTYGEVKGLSYEAKVVRLIHAAHEFARVGNREGLLETLRGLATLMGMQPNELIGQFRRGTRDSVVLRAVRTAIGNEAIEIIGGLIRRGKTGEAVRGGELGRVK